MDEVRQILAEENLTLERFFHLLLLRDVKQARRRVSAARRRQLGQGGPGA